MSFYKEVPGRQTTLESTLKFDTTPTAGSTNPVTSDGVKSAIDGAVEDASAALQEQIDEIAEKAGSGYIPKGEASVATLNALSGQENGELYTMTDSGTLTDGSLAVSTGDTVAWDATNSVWYKAMDYAPRQYGTNEVHNLPTTITAFRAGDVIPVDGPSGTAKMSKDDLLKETAENVQTKIVPRNLRDGILNSNGVSPFENFATSSGRYEFTQDDFVLQSALNRLSSELLFCPKGDTIHIVPEDGLTIKIVRVLVHNSPWTYVTVATITEETEYEFVQNSYYYIMVTNGSTIAIADYGNTKIDVRNSVLFKAKDFENTDSFLAAKVLLDVGETHKKIDNIFATKDGRINLSRSDFVQNGAKLLSIGIDVKVGDHFIFDGSVNSSKAAVLRKTSGGSYVTIVGTSSNIDYVSDADMTIYIDLRIEGSTYRLGNFAFGTCVLALKMSDKTIDGINARLDLLDAGGTIPYYGYVKNGRWCAGVPSESSTNRADYLAIEMPDKVKKVGCKFYYADNATSKGTVALAVMPDGWNRKVHGITSKSLHLILTPNQVKVDFLGQAWGQYWYTNLLTQTLELDTSSNVEHLLSMEIVGEQVIVNVDGTTYTGTNTSDKSMDEVAGKYAFVEHYCGTNTLNIGMPEFTAFRVESQTKVAFDAFKRENGVCWLTPQGMPYINLSQDAVYGDFSPTSYPDW